jgi:hypothetical protein
MFLPPVLALLTLLAPRDAGAVECTVSGSEIPYSVNVNLGLEFAPVPRLIYGAEARFCVDAVSTFARVERHGRGHTKLLLGARVYPFLFSPDEADDPESDEFAPREYAGAELGVAWQLAGGGREQAVAVHAGVSYGGEYLGATLQTALPVWGDRAHYDVSLVAQLTVLYPLVLACAIAC